MSGKKGFLIDPEINREFLDRPSHIITPAKYAIFKKHGGSWTNRGYEHHQWYRYYFYIHLPCLQFRSDEELRDSLRHHDLVSNFLNNHHGIASLFETGEKNQIRHVDIIHGIQELQDGRGALYGTKDMPFIFNKR